MKASLGSKLKTLRKLKRMSQEEVGNYLGVTRQNYSGYERGVINPPNAMIKKLAILYNMTTDQLLDVEVSENDDFDLKETLDNLINDVRNTNIKMKYNKIDLKHAQRTTAVNILMTLQQTLKMLGDDLNE